MFGELVDITQTFKTPNYVYNWLVMQNNVTVVKSAKPYTNFKIVDYLRHKQPRYVWTDETK